mmetsp:Transcript_22479/g.29402  ORF Transcript_22479/g.29402 Transcript_22479/m.29402 type:complete len:453 (+) Transcript_22479:165-1523(+)
MMTKIFSNISLLLIAAVNLSHSFQVLNFKPLAQFPKATRSTKHAFKTLKGLSMSINPDVEIQQTMANWLSSISPGDTHSTRDVKYLVSDSTSIVDVMIDFWEAVCSGIDDYVSKGSPKFHRDLQLFTLPLFHPTVQYQNLVKLQELILEAKPICSHLGGPVTLMHYHPDFVDNNKHLQGEKHSRYWAQKRQAPFASLSISSFYRELQIVDIEPTPEEKDLSPEELLELGMRRIVKDIQEQEDRIEDIMQDIYSMVDVDPTNIPLEIVREAVQDKMEQAKTAGSREMCERMFNLPTVEHPPLLVDDGQAAKNHENAYAESTEPDFGLPSSINAEEYAQIHNWVTSQTGKEEQNIIFSSVLDGTTEHMYYTVWQAIKELISNSKPGKVSSTGIMTPNFFPNNAANFYIFASIIQKTLETFPMNHKISFQVYHPESLDFQNKSPCPIFIIDCEKS